MRMMDFAAILVLFDNVADFQRGYFPDWSAAPSGVVGQFLKIAIDFVAPAQSFKLVFIEGRQDGPESVILLPLLLDALLFFDGRRTDPLLNEPLPLPRFVSGFLKAHYIVDA
jgi:hypothetical protein